MAHAKSLSQFQSRQVKSTFRLFIWTAAWVGMLAIFAFGPKFVWNESPSLTFAAFAACIVVGVGWVIATKNHIQGMDEMIQKVHLDALGITLGLSVIIGLPYSLLDAYGLAPFEPRMAYLLFLMSPVYLISILMGLRRYR